MRIPTNRPPIHPGEILLEEFMKPYSLTQTEIARRIGVSCKHINEVVNGRRGIDPDMALRLSRLFGTSLELWLNGQTALDVWHAIHGENACKLKAIEPVTTLAQVGSPG
ncbi:MAG: HigA family addiction module antitoxin [bacterium]|nr:HigA family addiction module antitoxin [bacterium]